MTDKNFSEESIIEIAPLIDEELLKPTKVVAERETRDESIMWVAYNEPNMTKRMSYLVHRLKDGLTTKLHAYGLAIGTAIWMSSNIRHQFSGVTQKATIMELKDGAKHRESFGIEIVLCVASEGQVVERKKQVARTFNKARRSPKSSDLPFVKPTKSAQTTETSA